METLAEFEVDSMFIDSLATHHEQASSVQCILYNQ